jgi:hypothetical protein
VWTVLGYGVEIWGWKERESVEKLEERYLRWVLEVDARTQGYMVREELQREKMKSRVGRRAWSFEVRLEEKKGSELARKYRKEMRERGKGGRVGAGWEEERRIFFEERGLTVEEMKRKREEGEAG